MSDRDPNKVSGRARRKQAEKQAEQRRTMMIIGIPVVIALIVGIFFVVNSTSDDSSNLAAITAPTTAFPAAEIARNGNGIGDPNAPVKVTEWGDFQ